MTTNETLAQYSDWAFKSAFTVLVLAFVLLIVQYASARAKAVQDKELVSAGGVDASVPGRVAETPSKSLSERFGGMGRAVLVVGTVLDHRVDRAPRICDGTIPARQHVRIRGDGVCGVVAGRARPVDQAGVPSDVGLLAGAGSDLDVPRRHGPLRRRGSRGSGAALVLASDSRDDRQRRLRNLHDRRYREPSVPAATEVPAR